MGARRSRAERSAGHFSCPARHRLFRCGDPRGRRVLVPPLPSALPKFPGNFTPCWTSPAPHHRWPRGGVYAEDRSGSESNKTSQPHGQLLRLSGRRRTEPQFFHSSPGERAASFVFAFCVFFVQKPCSGPPCAAASGLRGRLALCQPSFWGAQGPRGPVTVQETKNTFRRRTGRIPFLFSLQCFNRESLPLSTVILVKMHQRNIFCFKTCLGSMILIEIR